MTILKTISLSILLVSIASVTSIKANINSTLFAESPAKTICIKHPEAVDANKFFAKATIINFEIFKVGSASELDKIVKILSSDANVESCTSGKITGDFSAITLNLKSAKNKVYFINLFKKAGLTHIKLNNSDAVETDKL